MCRPLLSRNGTKLFLEKKLLEREGKMKKNVGGGRRRGREGERCVCVRRLLSEAGAWVHQRPCYNEDWVINNVHVVSGLNNACFQRC